MGFAPTAVAESENGWDERANFHNKEIDKEQTSAFLFPCKKHMNTPCHLTGNQSPYYSKLPASNKKLNLLVN
ncbi:14170_t:CDS:2, partial [Gigaspora margarita]